MATSDAQHRDNSQPCPARLVGTRRCGGRTVRQIFADGAARPPYLRDKEDFLRVRVLYFGPGREAADIHVTRIRSVWTRDEAGLVRHRNPVRQIAFGRLVHGGRGRLRRRFHRRSLGWRRAGIGIVRLRRGRILRGRRRGGILRRRSTRGTDRRFVFTGRKESKGTEKKKRERKFHKRFRRQSIRCNSMLGC